MKAYFRFVLPNEHLKLCDILTKAIFKHHLASSNMRRKLNENTLVKKLKSTLNETYCNGITERFICLMSTTDLSKDIALNANQMITFCKRCEYIWNYV